MAASIVGWFPYQNYPSPKTLLGISFITVFELLWS